MVITTLSLGDVNFLDCVEAVQKDSLPSPIQYLKNSEPIGNMSNLGIQILCHIGLDKKIHSGD